MRKLSRDNHKIHDCTCIYNVIWQNKNLGEREMTDILSTKLNIRYRFSHLHSAHIQNIAICVRVLLPALTCLYLPLPAFTCPYLPLPALTCLIVRLCVF